MINRDIALRAQDFHEALKETIAYGPKEVYFEKTLLIGKAAILAMHLKGLIYIEDIPGLKYAAAELGIRSLELETVLRQLETVDFISIVKSGDNIKRVDIRVPEFRDGYQDLGTLWSDLQPSEIEHAGVSVLQQLLSLPMTDQKLLSLGLDSTALAILKDVMMSGQLIRMQPISGERVIYSPLAVDANPVEYLRWTQKYSDRVADALKTLTNHQGLPMSSSQIVGNEVLEDAILTGILLPVRIEGVTGEQKFLFAPKGGLPAEERVITDKGRAILACVRYGQNFSAGRPIKHPRAILEHLRTKRKFRRGHPDLHAQYSLLVEKLIGRPIKESGDNWNFEIIDTPENLKALDVAIDMLEIGETPSRYINIAVKSALLNPHRYLSPTSARPILASSIKGSPETRADIVRKLGELGRGIIDVHN